jgi:hypothetical protein
MAVQQVSHQQAFQTEGSMSHCGPTGEPADVAVVAATWFCMVAPTSFVQQLESSQHHHGTEADQGVGDVARVPRVRDGDG